MAIRSMTENAGRREITDLLVEWSRGDQQALESLIPRVTEELRRVAKRQLNRESPGHTLQPTALVNELYLRLVDRRKMDWRDRAHFFASAARTMRHILVDHARARRAAKRGGELPAVALDEARDQAASANVDILALHDALKSLATMDVRQSQIVELRTFAGLNRHEIASVLGVSVATVSREWASAKAWLFSALAMR